MTMTAVTSSNIKAAGLINGTLHLTFHNDFVYEYPGAGLDVYTAMLAAPSVGKFFHAEIRNRYEGRRVNPADIGQSAVVT